MRLQKLAIVNQKKPTVFMDEKAEMQEEKERAIISIVHEIRNPLTAIKLTNQLMQEAFDRHENDRLLLQSYASMIANNIERIEKRLKEVLAYHNTEVTMQPLNVCDCIDKALCEAKDRIYLSGIIVSNNYKGSHWVYGNEEKLVTAFLNIIINAVEAIKTSDGRIWISVYKANNSIRITFKDNGSGMESGITERMFDPYFSTKDGLGIGLSSVKEILTMHKAQILADSLPGIGTSVSILINSIPEEQIPTMKKRVSGPVSGDGQL